MNYLILLVLQDSELGGQVLDAWNEAGVTGATILYSSGMRMLKLRTSLREDLPLMPGLGDLFRHEEVTNRTIFTLVEGEELVGRVVDATQAITGDLNRPNTGVLAVIPLAQVYGLNRREGE